MLELYSRMALARAAVERVGSVLVPHFRDPLETGRRQACHDDGAIAADQASEEAIRRDILDMFRSDGIFSSIGSEVAGSSGWEWWINPIDEPSSFVLGQLHWMTLVGLTHRKRPVAGLAFQPYVHEGFIGIAGGAHWWHGEHGKTCKTRPCRSLDDAALCIPYRPQAGLAAEREALVSLIGRVRLVRDSGASYGYCLLAMGLIDIVVDLDLSLYAINSLIPIVESAGGTITDWGGNRCRKGGRVVATGDRTLHRQVLEALHWDSTI